MNRIQNSYQKMTAIAYTYVYNDQLDWITILLYVIISEYSRDMQRMQSLSSHRTSLTFIKWNVEN